MRKLLKEIAVISSGQNAPQGSNDYSDNGIPFVKAGNLYELLNGRDINEIQKVSNDVAKKYKLKLFKKGTILFAKSGMSCLKGYVYILPCDAYVVNHLACVIPKENISDYLCYFFNYHKPNQLIKDSAYPSISLSDIGNIAVNLVEDSERVHHVQVLDRIQKIVLAKKQELKLLDDLIKARFVEMFGDPVKNPFGLPLKKLSELGTLDRGRSKHRPRNAPELLNGPYPLIQTGEVAASDLYITEYHNTYSEIGLKQSKMWKAGTLCITIAANIAQTAIMSFDACFPDSVVGFVPGNKMSALYLHYWFGFFQKILEEQAPQVAQKNINLKILSDLKVVVPVREQLTAFETFVTQVDKSKVVYLKAAREYHKQSKVVEMKMLQR